VNGSSLARSLRRHAHRGVRAALTRLPRALRFAVYRRMIDCDPAPDARLSVHVASQRDELEACFRLLHDAYVASGFMRPHASGLRVTPWHALPTTTTIAATWDGEVVGTLSLIREGVFGFPLQSVFDLSAVRQEPGRVAEVSALAVHPRFRKTGGAILFPLLKFMYAYCTSFFDTRHLVIAVNPDRIEMYESLLLFERLRAAEVSNYDFANGAPAVGAALDLRHAPARFAALYGGRAQRRDLHRYFVETQIPQLALPGRRYFTTNDPVMTPALLDHFFNQRTRVFDTLDERQRVLLHAIYADPAYAGVLPPLTPGSAGRHPLRRHPRHSLMCPGTLRIDGTTHALMVTELSLEGFQALTDRPLARGAAGRLVVNLGAKLQSAVEATVVRAVPSQQGHVHGFAVHAVDAAWRQCVQALERSQTQAELAEEPTAEATPLPAC
jgi:hypothetical protein